MGNLSLKSEELYRLLYNASLFAKQKSVFGDVIRIGLNYEDLTVTASDDHIILLDKTNDVTYTGNRATATYYFDKKTVKGMLAALGEEKYPEDVMVPKFFADGGWTETKTVNYELFTLIEDMKKEHGYVGSSHVLWALNRDRLRLLGMLKTPGDTVYPIDFNETRSGTLERDVIQFKVGPTIRGFVAPLLRGELADTPVAEGLF